MSRTNALRSILSISIIAIGLLLFATQAFADIGTLRDRGSTGRTIDLTPEPTPTPASDPYTPPTPPPSSSTGGITSVITGDVDTGNNTGGNVTTGDESVEIHEVNIGPTNPPPPPPPPPAEAGPATDPAQQCDLRYRTGCIDGLGRVR